MATYRLAELLWPPDKAARRPRVLLGCSGSVATIKVPAIVERLEQLGVHVIVVPTKSALHFLRAAADAVTVAAAGAVVTVRSDLPLGPMEARAIHCNVFSKDQQCEGKDWDTDYGPLCESDSGDSLGLKDVLKVNKAIESEDRERVPKKCCGSKETCDGETENVRSPPSQCCMLAKLPSTSTVETQTEIAGVDSHLTRVPDNVVNRIDTNSSLSGANFEHANSVASHCLSCLKVLEAAGLGSFKTQTGSSVPLITCYETKCSARAGSQGASEESSSRSEDGGEGDPLSSCAWCATQRQLPRLVIAGDALEWEGWRGRGDPVLHIELRRWADLGIIAPLSANTLAKLANGLCDNLLTCVARAWDTNKPLLFCPAMNTHMYDHPLTGRQITALVELGYVEVPAVRKRLMCGDVGGGAMAEVETIVAAVWSVLQQQLNAPTAI